ncbi:DedA family protein [Thiolapillus sp.]
MQDHAFTLLVESFALGYWGALGIVALLMLESLPVVGLFMPGVFLMVGLGSLSGTSYLSFPDCVLYSVIGALLGDSIGYWLGYLGIERSFLHPNSKRSQSSHAMAEQLLKRHGRLAVFLGRFVWFFHPAVPFLAGATGIRPGWFYLADLPAVILWVILYAGIGHWATGMARDRTLEFMVGVGICLVLAGLLLLLRYYRSRYKPAGQR